MLIFKLPAALLRESISFLTLKDVNRLDTAATNKFYRTALLETLRGSQVSLDEEIICYDERNNIRTNNVGIRKMYHISFPITLGYVSRRGLIVFEINNTREIGYCNINPLEWACRNNYGDIARSIVIDSKANLKRPFFGLPFLDGMYTYLHWVCFYGYKDIVKMLITEAGCNLNEINSSYYTPLHIACENGFVDIARTLVVDGKADVNAKSGAGSKGYSRKLSNSTHENYTPLLLACSNGHAEIARMLALEGKADVNYAALYPNMYAQYIGITRWHNSGWTGLHFACGYNYIDIANMLAMETTADINARVCVWGFFNHHLLSLHTLSTHLL